MSEVDVVTCELAGSVVEQWLLLVGHVGSAVQLIGRGCKLSRDSLTGPLDAPWHKRRCLGPCRSVSDLAVPQSRLSHVGAPRHHRRAFGSAAGGALEVPELRQAHVSWSTCPVRGMNFPLHLLHSPATGGTRQLDNGSYAHKAGRPRRSYDCRDAEQQTFARLQQRRGHAFPKHFGRRRVHNPTQPWTTKRKSCQAAPLRPCTNTRPRSLQRRGNPPSKCVWRP